MKKIFLSAVLVFSFALMTGTCYAATLYQQLAGKKVKVYVSAPIDNATNKKADLAGLKTALENALKERKSISFEIVGSPEAADYTIDTSVTEFFWTPNDPVDMIGGLSMAAADAALIQDYVRMQALFTIKEVKNGSEVWKDTLLSTVTKTGMSEEQSVPLINEDMSATFVKTAFGKKATK
jgi:hypothetical protein